MNTINDIIHNNEIIKGKPADWRPIISFMMEDLDFYNLKYP